jgi:hypothetical protein
MKKAAKKFVVVRAYSGVFFGELLSKKGQTVELASARQVWSWDSQGLPEKVNTAGDLALYGPGRGSKVSGAVAHATIEQVGVMFAAQPEAIENFHSQRWGSK